MKIHRLIAGIIVPLFFGWIAYNKVLPDYTPPAEARNIHPAPPSKITVHNESMMLAEVKNPFRISDKIEEAKKEGWRIYYSNCISCHGDNLSGICAMSEPFCNTCNRLRLTADGKIINCLFSNEEIDLLHPLRSGENILPYIEKSIRMKKEKQGGQFDSLKPPSYILFSVTLPAPQPQFH